MISDNELILKARNGDDRALRELVERYMSFSREKAKGYTSSGLEYDDIVQEGMIGFLSAFHSYDPEKSASFRTYAGVCMDHRIISAINAACGKKHIPSSSIVSIDDAEAQSADVAADPEKMFFLKARTAEILSRIDSDLSDFEKKVFHLFFSGHSYEEIAAMTSSTLKSVDNAMQRVRKKLR
ncbi:MAG: sigma-70 family RNA polymerase sigma factor [Acutalibacteraceae bacterium]